MPCEHVILIFEEGKKKHHKKIQPDKIIYVCPLQLRVRQGDSVRWLYNDDGEFTCTFKKKPGPFGGQHQTITGKNGSSPTFKVTANKGPYHYTVDERFMKEDPVIIVDPSTGD
jgi:plastocyanin